MFDKDVTRLVFSASDAGISGYRLGELLYERFRVSPELTDEENVVAVVTFANEQGGHRPAGSRSGSSGQGSFCAEAFEKAPEKMHTKEFGVFALPRPGSDAPGSIFCPVVGDFAAGGCRRRVTKEMIVPYPPGIPLLCPGEIVTREHILAVRRYREAGCEFHGTADKAVRTLRVLRDCSV